MQPVLLLISLQQGWTKDQEASFYTPSTVFCTSEFHTSYVGTVNLGAVTLCLGDTAAAVKPWEKLGNLNCFDSLIEKLIPLRFLLSRDCTLQIHIAHYLRTCLFSFVCQASSIFLWLQSRTLAICMCVLHNMSLLLSRVVRLVINKNYVLVGLTPITTKTRKISCW